MKKMTEILKATLMMVVVLVMAQGCIPNGGGGVTLTNTFNVGLNSATGNTATKILVDGDSIGFLLEKKDVALSGGARNILIKSFDNINKYQYLAFPDYTPNPQYNISCKILPAGVTINNTTTSDSLAMWRNVQDNNMYSHSSQSYISSSFGTASGGILLGTFPSYGISSPQYIVFRKDKGAGNYNYYWVELQPVLSLLPLNEQIISKGRFNLNSITTGQ